MFFILIFWLQVLHDAFKKGFYLFIGREWERERERSIDWLPLAHTPSGDLQPRPAP